MGFEIIKDKTIADIAKGLAEGASRLEVNISGSGNRCSAEFVVDGKRLPITTSAHALTGVVPLYARTIANKVEGQKPKISLTLRYNGEKIYPSK